MHFPLVPWRKTGHLSGAPMQLTLGLRPRVAPLEVVDAVRAGNLAVLAADASIEINKYKAVFLPLEPGFHRTHLDAGGVGAVLAEDRQAVGAIAILIHIREDVDPVLPRH